MIWRYKKICACKHLFSPLSCPFPEKAVPTLPQNLVLHFSFVAISKTSTWDTKQLVKPETLWSYGVNDAVFLPRVVDSQVSFRRLLKHCLLLGALSDAQEKPNSTLTSAPLPAPTPLGFFSSTQFLIQDAKWPHALDGRWPAGGV